MGVGRRNQAKNLYVGPILSKLYVSLLGPRGYTDKVGTEKSLAVRRLRDGLCFF